MSFLKLMLLILFTLKLASPFAQTAGNRKDEDGFKKEIIQTLRRSILSEATEALKQQPITITAEGCSRSAGGKHDYYSEGDYWWPDPSNPNGPYVQKDGMTNPDNFVAHRQALMRFSKIMGALASAYVVTRNDMYVANAFVHARAWFVDTTTMMNPSLLYAQAIKGKATGRGIGIIDTIHLMEVAQGILVMEKSPAMDRRSLAIIKNWFAQYLTWLTTHVYGKDEMNAENNHGTCWVMQVASFAKLTENSTVMDVCRERYKNILLPAQLAADGSFPRELKRTKPYSYSLFNLDAMTIICQILSDEKDNLWKYQTTDGNKIQKGIDFIFPYVLDKNKWPYPKDVMYWDNWPVAHPFLAFGALAYNNKAWLAVWKTLNHTPDTEEVLRNLPIRNPVIWLQNN